LNNPITERSLLLPLLDHTHDIFDANIQHCVEKRNI